jgi:IS5 family transposase
MLRIYFLQQWFNLSDPAVEEALYDSAVMRQLVGIDLGCEPVPDETTLVSDAVSVPALPDNWGAPDSSG